METETYLYPYSAGEAKDRGELALWRASHQANIACKKAIERAIRNNHHGAFLEENCLQSVLQNFGYKRTAWVLANTVQQLDGDSRISGQNQSWASQTYIPPDN